MHRLVHLLDHLNEDVCMHSTGSFFFFFKIWKYSSLMSMKPLWGTLVFDPGRPIAPSFNSGARVLWCQRARFKNVDANLLATVNTLQRRKETINYKQVKQCRCRSGDPAQPPAVRTSPGRGPCCTLWALEWVWCFQGSCYSGARAASGWTGCLCTRQSSAGSLREGSDHAVTALTL